MAILDLKIFINTFARTIVPGAACLVLGDFNTIIKQYVYRQQLCAGSDILLRDYALLGLLG